MSALPGPVASPATAANVVRNGLERPGERRVRWGGTRDAAWAVLSRHLPRAGTVAVIGAGNGDDLPLRRLAEHVDELDLYDIDGRALKRARRRIPAATRHRVRTVRCDISAGAADQIARTAGLGRRTPRIVVNPTPLGVGGYDVVIGDLLYTQLLYPALLDSGLPASTINRTLRTREAALTEAVVSRMNASVRPGGLVIHLHDAVGWWPGRSQPVSLEEILEQPHVTDQLALIRCCKHPTGSDPRDALMKLEVPIRETAFWEWPFTPDARYLVCATVTEPRR